MRDRFVDIFLLSIIRAHDHHANQSDEQRLSAAREALFGQNRPRGRRSLADELAIFKITDELRKPEMDKLRKSLAQVNREFQSLEWEAELKRKPMSARAAAKKFSSYASLFRGVKTSDENLADRLRAKARSAKLTSKDMAELEAILHIDSPHLRSIAEILELLDTLGIKSAVLWENNS